MLSDIGLSDFWLAGGGEEAEHDDDNGNCDEEDEGDKKPQAKWIIGYGM